MSRNSLGCSNCFLVGLANSRRTVLWLRRLKTRTLHAGAILVFFTSYLLPSVQSVCFRTSGSLRRLRRDGSWSGVPLIGKNTKAAPNSSTGSGRCLFPGNDGMVSLFLSFEGKPKRYAPETFPCHVQAKQDGELDPQRVTRVSPGAFPRNQDRDGTLDRRMATHRLSSTLTLHVGSLGKTPARSKSSAHGAAGAVAAALPTVAQARDRKATTAPTAPAPTPAEAPPRS